MQNQEKLSTQQLEAYLLLSQHKERQHQQSSKPREKLQQNLQQKLCHIFSRQQKFKILLLPNKLN